VVLCCYTLFMTSAHKPIFLVVSQNQDIGELVKDTLLSNGVTVETSQPSKIEKIKLEKIHYIIFLIQRSLDNQDITTSLINLSDLAKTHQSKIAIVDIHKNQIQEEVVENTLQLLNQVSTKPPLFRYILTKDLFQDQDDKTIFTLEQDIQLVSHSQKIDVSSRGENLIYPLNLRDLVSAVLKSLFLERMAGKQLTIIGDPLKDLELAYTIKDELEKVGKNLNIDTIKKDVLPLSSTLNASAKSRALLKWLPVDTNEHKLKRKISTIITKEPDQEPIIFNKKPPPIKTEDAKPSKKINLHKIEKKFLISIPIILITISVFSFIVLNTIYLFLLGASLKKTKASLDHLNKGDIAAVNQEIQVAEKYLQIGENISHYVLPIYKVFSSELTSNINNFSSLLKHSQATTLSINESYQLANNFYHDLFTPSGESSARDMSIAIQSRLRTIHQELSQIEIISRNHTFPNFFNQKLKEIDFAQKIDILINQTSQSLKLLESFSTLLDSSDTQYVALLIQDINELKSSGGTIRSVILANVENQKIRNIRVLSSGQIDQQMIGQVPAPPEIESLTGQENLSFTNSNTSANFTTTSLLVDKFLKESLNFNPDLIIAITTQTLEDVLKELGSLSTNEIVFSPNSFNQELANSNLNHTTSKTTNLLLEKIVEDLQTQNLPLVKLVRPIINTLNQDDLRVWFKDPSKENSIINYPFAGNIFMATCHPLLVSSNCLADAGHLAENNLSVAPFNFYQDRKLQHNITIQDRSVLHTFVLDYVWHQDIPRELNRDYQVLYQIYLHPSAKFISLEKNNQETDTTISKENYNDLSLFQIPLSITPKDSISIKINFILEDVLPPTSSKNFAYSIKTFHQPGTSNHNNQLVINYPQDLAISGITFPGSIGSSQIIYQSSADSSLNSVFGVQFAY
jgi:hypothetical protein